MTEAEALDELAELWRRERHAARRQHRERRAALSFDERVVRGLALRNLRVQDTDATVGQRVLLWVEPESVAALEAVRLGNGDPVLLWAESPEGEQTQRAIVSRLGRGRLGLVVDADYAEFLDEGAFALEPEAPEVTFDRGDRAIERLRLAKAGSDLALMRALLFGSAPPEALVTSLHSFDVELNAVQQRAVELAMGARQLALIHGPPGTGKTRTLAEVVRQAVARGERVLCSAASNTAVDNLAERLVAAKLPLVRLGHPARVSSALEAFTLDAQLDKSEVRKRVKRLTVEANELRRKAQRRRARGSIDRRGARELYVAARQCMKDARALLDAERERILSRAKVICATAVGADNQVIGDLVFDRVLLDEATQAVDPVALAALSRGKVLVLAGDPCQLPPTVVDPDCAREGLGTTLFERLIERYPDSGCMLEVQHRMHEGLMAFPSESMYGGRLVAAPAVARHRLAALGVADDPLRPEPLCFLDTAGKGFAETRDPDDPSTRNQGQAERVAAEVRRLLSRGVAPDVCAVITPYLAQVRLLRDALRDAVEEGLEVDTVDGFQGREKEAVVVDLVRSNEQSELGFLTDVRRMNVALTRARRFLMVVGDSATLGAHPYYRRFIELAEQRGAYLSAWNDDAELL